MKLSKKGTSAALVSAIVLGAVGIGAMLSTTTTTAAVAQQQAPGEGKGKGQGPPFTQGICITTGNENYRDLSPGELASNKAIRDVCSGPSSVSNAGECMQIIKEFPGIFGSAIDTNEECKAAFPYSAPHSHNPND